MSTPQGSIFHAKSSSQRGYGHPFSGKLSPVTPTFDKQIPLELPEQPQEAKKPAAVVAPREIGGRDGPEPTRFGDWELRGRCIDF
jgi:hypothetical protein